MSESSQSARVEEERDEPWEMNYCITIRADSEDEADEVRRKLDATARRHGQTVGFTDYSGPQKGGIDG